MSEFPHLIQSLRLHRPEIIGVDGDLGAGKTTVADQISAQLRFPCLHLDAFLLKGRGTYLPHIRTAQLRASIDARKGPIVVEGLCLLAALAQISVQPDFLVFVDPEARYKNATKASRLQAEVQRYFAKYSPRAKANSIVSLEDKAVISSSDTDIAYIKSKTVISVTLAVGGVVQTLAGALLLNAGLNNQGTATFQVMGAKVSATGLGGIVLCTSVMWAYFAYLARPKFSSRTETRNTKRADGSSEVYEFRSSTQAAAEPETHRSSAAPADSPAAPRRSPPDAARFSDRR